MPVRNDREYRAAEKFEANDEMIVEGYASTFQPYVLYSDGENSIYERIDPHAFDEADMDDVIMQYDHEGGTLEVSVDDHGLKIRADLSKTEGARSLYEDIRSGMITQMSFAFTIGEESYDKGARQRNILKVGRVYDVSAVSIPANPGTEISARSFCDGVIAEEQAERLAAEERERKIKILRLRLEV